MRTTTAPSEDLRDNGRVIPEDSRFENDPDVLLDDHSLPDGWEVTGVELERDLERLTELLRRHEEVARGWASSEQDDVLVEISPRGQKMRANVVLRDPDGLVQGWGSVHDRAAGRMMFLFVVNRDMDVVLRRRCARVLCDWADGQAAEVGAARELDAQQIDTGAFAGDESLRKWLSGAGYTHVRTWWQMSRPVETEEANLVPDPASWSDRGARFRRVTRAGDGMPDSDDLHAVHDVLEGAFADHFNSHEETFDEFVHRLREDPGHRWDHWWLVELTDSEKPEPAGALVATVSESDDGPSGSYVAYIGVLGNARGRGVGKGLLRTVIADAAKRGRNRVGLEVDADSPTGADGLYTSMGWVTGYVTESWHREVPSG